MKPLHLIDCTLREGNQAPSGQFTIEQSLNIASMLDLVGIDMIECGHPFVSEREKDRVKAIVSKGLRCPVLSHARARKEDIDAVKESGAEWIGIFCGINNISRHTRLGGRSRDSVLEMITSSVAYAKTLGLKVRYTLEDATRTPRDMVIFVMNEAINAGANRICYADTLGAMSPSQMKKVIAEIHQALPGVDLEVHIHDDRGFATANALIALESGANWVSCSVNGIGERCGITDLALLMANLDLEGLKNMERADVLQHLSKYVGSITRSYPDHRRPVIGQNAFTHTAKLHTNAVKKVNFAYSVFDTSKLCRETSIVTPKPDYVIDSMIVKPPVICSTELKYHGKGPGRRYVMIDDRFVNDPRQYCIVREIPYQHEPAAAHVDPHRHSCDSLFLFIGDQPGLTGLTVEIMFENETRILTSPASLFIPASVLHSYRVLHGAGKYINHVLAGDYNSSLLDDPTIFEVFNQLAIHQQIPITKYDAHAKTALQKFISAVAGCSIQSLHDDLDLLDEGIIDLKNAPALLLHIKNLTGVDINISQVDLSSLRSVESILKNFLHVNL